MRATPGVAGLVFLCSPRKPPPHISFLKSLQVLTSVVSLYRLPYLLRFRQCIADFNTTPIQNTSALYRSNSNTPSDPRNRALCNALKYATAFPVIIFSAMQVRYTCCEEVNSAQCSSCSV